MAVAKLQKKSKRTQKPLVMNVRLYEAQRQCVIWARDGQWCQQRMDADRFCSVFVYYRI